jgi:UDP-N-acetylglucosamine--N-acetylmuramyl-(pentapeptide) pyrophosphoryl-undecaprenol N-acetylglucosamine transferase
MSSENQGKRLLIAGGGTGGHVLAGVAIADAWKAKNGADAQVLFVGAQGGMEEKLVPRAGYSLKLLKLGSLNRVSLGRRVKTMIQLPLSFLNSIAWMIQFKPQVVLGVGGYASGPVVLFARVLSAMGILRAQVGILEQNSVPGMTNRILGKFSHFIFAAFPGTESKFPSRPVQITGNPIRSSMKLMPQATRDPFTIFIFGGSQGALGINSVVLEALPFLKDLNGKIRWIHQTGEKDYQRVVDGYAKAGVSARVEKFIYEMPTVYGESSLLICRAGSSTLAEIAAVGRASILIPLPTAADNHQEENAKVFVKANAALLFQQGAGKGEALAKLVRDLMGNPAQLETMEKNVVAFFKPHAAEDVVRLLKS